MKRPRGRVVLRQPPGDRPARSADALAAGVTPRGTLLIVGHHPTDIQKRHPGRLADFSTAEEVADSLDPAIWEVVAADAPSREVIRDGEPRVVTDAVLLARRRA